MTQVSEKTPMIEPERDMFPDIIEHLDYMTELARDCDVIVEFGVREGGSTHAWLRAEPKQLISIDILEWVLRYTRQYYDLFAADRGIDFQVRQGDSLKVEPIPCDLLFIDTDHTYDQLLAELRRHGDSARKYIVCHDTVSAPDCFGAVGMFCRSPNWKIKEHFTHNSGLTVLERVHD